MIVEEFARLLENTAHLKTRKKITSTTKHAKGSQLSSEQGLLLGFFVECKATRLHYICELFHSFVR